MTDATELEPPWACLPEIPQGSIGWRMGGGEDYLYRWFAFAREHWTSQAAALTYLRRHPPAPHRWAHFVIAQLLEIDQRAGVEPANAFAGKTLAELLQTMLIGEKLVGDDVAYPVYVRNRLHLGELPVPWLHIFGGDKSLDMALRYSARELGWWARWLGTECRDRATYLDRYLPPPHWVPVFEQIGAGVSTAWRSPHQDLAGLIAATVQHGRMPPPWSGEHPHEPLDRETSWEIEAADDRDHWMWWVHGAFDDTASWRAYLERWPAPPPWQPFIERKLRGVGTRFYG